MIPSESLGYSLSESLKSRLIYPVFFKRDFPIDEPLFWFRRFQTVLFAVALSDLGLRHLVFLFGLLSCFR